MAIERENAHRRSEACACTRATSRRRGQANAPQSGTLTGVNVATLRQMRGKSAKSLLSLPTLFNIIRVMRLNSISGSISLRNARFDPPLLRRGRVQKLMT
jgi:hypothetical protein